MIYKRKKKFACTIVLFGSLLMLFSLRSQGQIPPEYSIARWFGNKKAAVTYTFDDFTAKQFSVALPLFEHYNFKVTLYPVTGWAPDWSRLKAAASKGHEIGCHSATHPDLSKITVSNQENELKTSLGIINGNITSQKCLTIAYPYCVPGDNSLMKKYFIAGRICSGAIEPATPQNLYGISCIIGGSGGSVKTATDLNGKIEAAKNSGGWCVFLFHGIDDDGGYSPVASAELATHLKYVNENNGSFWVATFSEAVRYISERNAVSIKETAIAADTLHVEISDQLDNQVYHLPLTVRRMLPSNWQNAAVYVNGRPVESEVMAEGTKMYLTFNAVPDGGTIRICKSEATSGIRDWDTGKKQITFSPNPFSEKLQIRAQGDMVCSFYTTGGILCENGEGQSLMEAGRQLRPGFYLLYIENGFRRSSFKVVKQFR